MVRREGASFLADAGSDPPRVLLGLLGLLALAVPVYVLAPLPDAFHRAVYDAVGAGSVLLGAIGARRNRSKNRTGWFLVLFGYFGWVCGDLVWTAEQYVLPDRYPAPSDVFYLSSYLLLGAGALMFVRSGNGGRDLAAVLDASIITTGIGVLVGVFLIMPLAGDSTLSLAAKIVSSAYPLGDLFLVGVIARMYAGSGVRTASHRLLSASLILTLCADVSYNVVALISDDPASSRWTDGVWLFGYILAGAAACTSSMRQTGEPASPPSESVPTLSRLAGLAGGLMLPAIALLVDGATGAGVHWPLIGIGTLLLSGLVLARMVGLLKVVHIQSVRLSALARSDHLTGAPNRRTWDHELARACALARQTGTTLCVAILDLDRFKVYNDTHGHQAGDRMLQDAVAAWTEVLPQQALLARYGGEEFAVLVPGVGTQEVSRMLQRLQAVTPGGQTFSAGVALWDPGGEPNGAVAAADEALYAAKRAGRDRVLVHGQRPRTSDVVSEPVLPALKIVTQPIVDVRTLAVCAHEALTRFTGPERNRDVEEVFRHAHAGGYGDLLELAAIRAALELPGRPEGHELYVNASARALTTSRFFAGLPARLNGVVFELGEDPDGVAPYAVLEAVARLRTLGARIALDDVGAGGQEFARLATLRPDAIKVDRSLVDGCAESPSCTAVVRALVGYAQELGVTVCAEGVEHLSDLRHLAELQVSHAQGYLLARPGQDWQPIVVATGLYQERIPANLGPRRIGRHSETESGRRPARVTGDSASAVGSGGPTAPTRAMR